MATYPTESFQTKTGRVVTIRHCTPEDIDSFMEFQPRIAAESNHTLQMTGREPNREGLHRAWALALADPVALKLAAFSGHEMIAHLGLYYDSESQHPWTRHITSFGMMIVKDFWSEGIGRRLLEIAENHARACGITRIQALVRVKNERGVRLYTRMGYEIEGTRRQGAVISGEHQDEHYIAKLFQLEPPWLPPVLETQRLILRPLTLDDVDSVYEYAKDPKVTEHVTWEAHKTSHDSKSFILDHATRNYQRKIPEPWAITLRSNTKHVIGTVGCTWVSKNARSMEIGYVLGTHHWGQGLMPEASRAAIDYCFKEFDLNRIQARCMVENIASARVMEKIGMHFEGTMREAHYQRGRFWNLHHYAILKSEWFQWGLNGS